MPTRITHLISFSLLISASTPLAQAAEYAPGNGALELWNVQAMQNLPLWLTVWLGIMAVSFALGLFFVRRHPIARWVVGGFILGIVFSGPIASAMGIIPLSGFVALVHVVCWSPALYQLLSKRPFLNGKSAFAIWSGLITAVILFSFIFDIRDAFIYLGHIL